MRLTSSNAFPPSNVPQVRMSICTHPLLAALAGPPNCESRTSMVPAETHPEVCFSPLTGWQRLLFYQIKLQANTECPWACVTEASNLRRPVPGRSVRKLEHGAPCFLAKKGKGGAKLGDLYV